MARRVSWTNNSSGHSGTYVYRAPTLDPQNLPAPVATVDPVAQGETAEWIDNSDEYGCFAVQDFDGQGVGMLSTEVCITDPWASVQIGDNIEGGIYAGIITYPDAREFHLIFAKQAGEAVNTRWGVFGATTGATSTYDGQANQDLISTSGDNAFNYCRSYVDEAGNNDYYLPARSELAKVDALVDMSHPEFSTSLSEHRWSSTEASPNTAWYRRFSDGYESTYNKSLYEYRTRPIRRIPV